MFNVNTDVLWTASRTHRPHLVSVPARRARPRLPCGPRRPASPTTDETPAGIRVRAGFATTGAFPSAGFVSTSSLALLWPCSAPIHSATVLPPPTQRSVRLRARRFLGRATVAALVRRAGAASFAAAAHAGLVEQLPCASSSEKNRRRNPPPFRIDRCLSAFCHRLRVRNRPLRAPDLGARAFGHLTSADDALGRLAGPKAGLSVVRRRQQAAIARLRESR